MLASALSCASIIENIWSAVLWSHCFSSRPALTALSNCIKSKVWVSIVKIRSLDDYKMLATRAAFHFSFTINENANEKLHCELMYFHDFNESNSCWIGFITDVSLISVLLIDDLSSAIFTIVAANDWAFVVHSARLIFSKVKKSSSPSSPPKVL